MAGIPKYAARRDNNESPIVKQLRDIPGVSVVSISVKGIGDLLVGREIDGIPHTFLIELKDGRNNLTDKQVKFRAMWTGQHAVCKTIEDILRVIGL